MSPLHVRWLPRLIFAWTCSRRREQRQKRLLFAQTLRRAVEHDDENFRTQAELAFFCHRLKDAHKINAGRKLTGSWTAS